MLKARDLMSRGVFTVEVNGSVDEVTDYLVKHAISGAPVMERGKMVGFVSMTDLARLGAARTANMSIRTVMNPFVFDVTEDTPASEIAEGMLRGRIHRVVVTRNGAAVGIVSAMDLLRVVRDLADEPTAVMQAS